jgi:hypothetical protein
VRNVTVLAETEAGVKDEGAILCEIEGEEIWIPKSQIHEDSEVYAKGTDGDLIITEWIAGKKGLL